MIFFDTETCGLHGLPVIIQYAVDNEAPTIYNFWTNPIQESMDLIEFMVNHEEGVCGFNLAFDWFQICKMYNTIRLYPDKTMRPEAIIDEMADMEFIGRDGPCLKPRKALDLMLHARKGPYQSTMDRSDIRIRRVPTQIAFQLAKELDNRVHIKDIYFARKKDKKKRWDVEDIHDDDGCMITEFKNVVLRFAPSSALKTLAADALGKDPDNILLFADVEVNPKFKPEEYGYAPYARAVGSRGRWNGAWPEVIIHHIDHWEYNSKARQYAEMDVVLLQELYEFFGRPESDDDDSVLSCMVAAIRYRGFKIDVPKIKSLRDEAIKRAELAPKSPQAVKNYIWPVLSPEERLAIGGSTKAVVLEKLSKELIECECGDGECGDCKDGMVPHPAAIRAKEVIEARRAGKEVELYDKLIKAGRFHASFKVIGTLSTRMAGADGLNPQGIKSTKEVRQCFPLSPNDDMPLCGGDFDSFEVCIACAAYDDPDLTADLMSDSVCVECLGTGRETCKPCKAAKKTGSEPPADCETCGVCKDCGGTGIGKKKIHGLFAESIYPDEDYESIIATKGTETDLYTRGKQGVFSQMYGGNEHTLMTKLGISFELASAASMNWQTRYKGIARSQKRINDMFCTMKQPHGIGSKVYYSDPADFMPSLLGFRRFFTLENSICEALFRLSENPPPSWKEFKFKVRRRKDGTEQTAPGAARSALIGAAYAIQNANERAAKNHEIQSTGAQITKAVQRRIWDHQPAGVNPWYVMPLNIHDEILSPVKKDIVEDVKRTVNDAVESYRPVVPLIKMEWSTDLKTWADK